MKHKWDSVNTNVSKILSFLQSLFDLGRSHSTITSACNAVSSVTKVDDGQLVNKHRHLNMYLQAVLNLRPPSKQNAEIWDTQTIFKWIRKQDSIQDVPTDWLAKRLAYLILIVSTQRPQVLIALKLSKMKILSDKAIFQLSASDIKHGKYSPEGHVIVLKRFTEKAICVVEHLIEYVKRTAKLRGKEDKLFIITIKPYTPATLNTLSNWVKQVLSSAGINTGQYGAGSTRAAAASKACEGGIPIDVLLKAAGWSNSRTFAKFYQKPIAEDDEKGLGDFVL